MARHVFAPGATSNQAIGSGSAHGISKLAVQISGLSGVSTLKVQGRPSGSAQVFTDLAWKNKTTDTVTTGATAIGANGLYEVDTTALDVNLLAVVAGGGALNVDYDWS